MNGIINEVIPCLRLELYYCYKRMHIHLRALTHSSSDQPAIEDRHSIAFLSHRVSSFHP